MGLETGVKAIRNQMLRQIAKFANCLLVCRKSIRLTFLK